MLVIATIGPKTLTEETLNKIIESGANSIRINFSHIPHHTASKIINYVKETYPQVKIIADIQGSKIRVSGKLKEYFKVKEKERVYFCAEDVYEDILKLWVNRDEKLIPLTIKKEQLLKHKITLIYMKDGTMKFNVKKVQGNILETTVVIGGYIRAEKGCNIPGIDRSQLSITEKDRNDILFSIKNSVDIILYSYVGYKKNIIQVKNFIERELISSDRRYCPKLWAKIETEEGAKNIKEILEDVEGIVLGRGDLVPETNLYKVPIFQHRIAQSIKHSRKDFIVATHIFDSLKNGQKPTVNELNDIFYLILSGVTGLMLTGETSVGKSPCISVKTLKYSTDYYEKILKRSENCEKGRG
ncbi:hypothetical protein CPJCM30710_22630 [Clostridium polyendosporum]|uniref:Pyruvate kinase n=1 Tax=Clostridium polyendosporum TaxID=69208 RepID=A0A919VGV8_9CLOT|nr:pyruvate kinase [Clostridium polyendosporum]GIM29597.1 hypothetical protein CPJCM30710_22630 [Clostridium polyendosporum]